MLVCRYVNSDSHVHWSAPGKGVWMDEDGTGMDGTVGQFAVAASMTDFLEGICTTANSAWKTTSTWFCPPSLKMARFAMYGMSPFSAFDQDTLYLSRIADATPRCSSGECSCGFGNSTFANCTFTVEGDVGYKNEKWKEPADGWAVPVATGHRYKVRWPNDPDFDQMTLEASYLMRGEYYYMEFSFLGIPDHYGIWVDGTRVADPSNETWPATTDTPGTSYINMEDRTLTVLFSGTGNEYSATTSKVYVQKFACPEVNGQEVCPLPPAPPPAVPEDTIRLWSNASMWIELGHDGVPAFPNLKDQVVKIPAEWTVMMDRDYVQLENLEVYGTLMFDEGLKSTTLRVQTLQIWGGTVIAGNSTHPFSSKLKIEFWAFPWSFPPVQVGSFVDAGTNVLANLGRLELYGADRPVRWTRLRQTSDVGSTWLYPDNFSSLDWGAGDEVVVASSTHDQFEAEKFTIAFKDTANERLLILGASVQNKHFGAAAAETHNSKTLDVRAEIGLLSNSIEITSAAFGVVTYGFGCHLLTTSYNGYSGSTVLTNVHVKECGQRDTSRYAVNFIGPSATNASSLSGVTISESLNIGLSIRTATNIALSDMVIYKTVGSSVDIVDSSDITLTVRTTSC